MRKPKYIIYVEYLNEYSFKNYFERMESNDLIDVIKQVYEIYKDGIYSIHIYQNHEKQLYKKIMAWRQFINFIPETDTTKFVVRTVQRGVEYFKLSDASALWERSI